MVKLLIYLLESSAVLAFFYLLYILVLRRETFFSLNRFFILGILVFSLLFPIVRFDFNPSKAVAVERPIEEISKLRMSYYEALALWEFENYGALNSAQKVDFEDKQAEAGYDWIKVFFIALFVFYAIGIGVCLSRLIWTFRWILKLISSYPQEKIVGVKIIKIPHPIAPFSFFKYIFVQDSLVQTPDFNQVLAHEMVHIRQRHSIDLIFVQLLAAFFWFNPVIWQLVKSLKTTHEFIADKQIIISGYSLVEYQTLLLRQLISSNSYGLVHNFNLTFIKKRITMMKNKQSGWSGKVKVASTIICSVIFSAIIVQCNSRLEEQVPVVTEKRSEKQFTDGIHLPVLYERKDPNSISDQHDLIEPFYFNIEKNKLTVNGIPHELHEIVPMLEKDSSPSGVIVMRIDKNQKMDFIRDVQTELRKAEQRRILYLGQTTNGEKVETSLLLPPTTENSEKYKIPQQPNIDDIIAAGKMDILKLSMGENVGATNQQRVYDFVKNHIQKQSSDYVVSARFNDADTYNDYLLNLVFIKDGFNQIYQERAQEMFGKNLDEISKEELQAVRKDVPMAISIAED